MTKSKNRSIPLKSTIEAFSRNYWKIKSLSTLLTGHERFYFHSRFIGFPSNFEFPLIWKYRLLYSTPNSPLPKSIFRECSPFYSPQVSCHFNQPHSIFSQLELLPVTLLLQNYLPNLPISLLVSYFWASGQIDYPIKKIVRKQI